MKLLVSVSGCFSCSSFLWLPIVDRLGSSSLCCKCRLCIVWTIRSYTRAGRERGCWDHWFGDFWSSKGKTILTGTSRSSDACCLEHCFSVTFVSIKCLMVFSTRVSGWCKRAKTFSRRSHSWWENCQCEDQRVNHGLQQRMFLLHNNIALVVLESPVSVVFTQSPSFLVGDHFW